MSRPPAGMPRPARSPSAAGRSGSAPARTGRPWVLLCGIVALAAAAQMQAVRRRTAATDMSSTGTYLALVVAAILVAVAARLLGPPGTMLFGYPIKCAAQESAEESVEQEHAVTRAHAKYQYQHDSSGDAYLLGSTRAVVAAASQGVMRAGRHYAQFSVLAESEDGFQPPVLFGVMRPEWDVEAGTNPQDIEGHCFFDAGTAYKFPGRVDWDGRVKHMAWEADGRIGLLLDLDQGTMNLYFNDEWCGVLAEGLTGEYTWAIGAKTVGQGGRIEAAGFEFDHLDEWNRERYLATASERTAGY